MLKVALFTVVAVFATGALAQDVPDLVGRWEGTTAGVTPEGFVKNTDGAAVVITEQEGRAFKGHSEYRDEGGEVGKADFMGVIATDGTILYVDDDGMVRGRMTAAGMDLCYIEVGDDAKASCGLYERK